MARVIVASKRPVWIALAVALVIHTGLISLRQAWCAPDDARRRRWGGFRGTRSQCAAGQRGRRLQFLESTPASDARARRGLLGIIRAPCHPGRSLQVRHHRPTRAASALEVGPFCLRNGNAAGHSLDRVRRGQLAASAPRARAGQRAELPGIDLRGSSRLLAAQGQQRMADLSRARRTATALCQGPRVYAY